jgi:uncharacterized membrane protein YccC
MGNNPKGMAKMSRDTVRIAVQNAVVCLLAYLGGLHFTRFFHGSESVMGALWSVISGFVVLQATRRQTLTSAGLRVLGTLIGAGTSAAYLSVLPFSPLGMAAVIGVTVLLCQCFGAPDHARLAAITVAVIMVVSRLNPAMNPVLNAALRFGESCIGAAVAVLAALVWPERDRGG